MIKIKQKTTVITKMTSIKYNVMTTLINDYNVNYKVHRLSNWYHTGRMKKDRLKISTTVFLAQTTAEKIGNGWDSMILIFPPVAYSKCTISFSKAERVFFIEKRWQRSK